MESELVVLPIHVPARDLYAPASISPEARSSLVIDPMADAEMPSASDPVVWKGITDLVNQSLVDQFGDIAVEGRFDRQEVDGVTVYTAVPASLDGGKVGRIFLDIHGGALIFGAGEACAAFTRQTLARINMTTWGVDYRMPPEYPYPAALDDCLTVYRSLLSQYSPGSIVVGGMSAGGNLAAALVLRARDEGLDMPAGLILLSPEVDLTESGDSFQTLLGVDTLLRRSLSDSITMYADGHDLSDPYLSPIFGDLRGFPPTFIQAGTRDLFLSNAVRMHRRLRGADVRAELHVFEAMPHGGFNLANPTPEDLEIASEVRTFLRTL
jgi:monoterpene epsilon-lactone hydrolase